MASAAEEPSNDIESIGVRSLAKRIGTRADIRAAETMSEVMARAMLSLWVRGANYQEIADEFGVNVPVARMAIERVLADSLDDNEDKTKQRARIALQLDAYLRSIIDRALDSDDPEQVGRLRLALQITDRKARLLGLDAPINVQFGLPQKDELDQWVAAVAMINGTMPPVEGDPFADVVELTEDPDTGEYR
jgi:hypothetical protein